MWKGEVVMAKEKIQSEISYSVSQLQDIRKVFGENFSTLCSILYIF